MSGIDREGQSEPRQRRAAAIEGLWLSGYVSALAKRHAWASQQPRLTSEEQAVADEKIAELDERELGNDGTEQRAAG